MTEKNNTGDDDLDDIERGDVGELVPQYEELIYKAINVLFQEHADKIAALSTDERVVARAAANVPELVEIDPKRQPNFENAKQQAIENVLAELKKAKIRQQEKDEDRPFDPDEEEEGDE